MFTVLKNQPIEYIALVDPAVDDDAMSVEDVREYCHTFNLGLLKLRPGMTPVTWVLHPLDPYTLEYAKASSPKDADGRLLTKMFCYHMVQAGLKDVKGAPEGAPKLNFHKSGMLELLDDAVVRCIDDDVVLELGGAIHRISVASDEAKKKSPSPSEETTSKIASPASPARSE